jgi:alanine racemase
VIPAGLRPAWAEVDLGAIRSNVAEIARVTEAPRVCAVVKADAYGHGAVPVARAALEGGASWLAVALVEEAASLRADGIEAPILVLAEPPAPPAMAEAARLDLRVAIYTDRGVDEAVAAGVRRVHVKVDTGMHRVGAAPGDVLALAKSAAAAGLDVEGVWTHFAVADEPDRDDRYTARQVERFDECVAELARAGVEPEILHASNSAGGLLAGAPYGMVRAGIAVYGYEPNPARPSGAALRPALSLLAGVSHAKRLPAGEAVSYGLRYRLSRDSWVATVPLGYADGVPRRLSAVGGEVLVGGARRPIAGNVTMDQLMVDCGDDPVEAGDGVVLIGEQGGERITADDWAARLDTISYEVLCGISPRVPRVHLP